MRQGVRTVLIVGSALALFFVAFPFLGRLLGDRFGIGHGMMGGWGWGLMPLSMLLFWGLVIWAAVLLIRWLGRPGEPEPDSPLGLLSKRYAGGEISREEFEEKRRDIA